LQAGAAFVEGYAKLVDCRILRCHSGKFSGGITVMSGTADIGFVEMIRGTISGCSAYTAGGAMLVVSGGRALLLDVLVADCQITGDELGGGGGGIRIGDGEFIMHGGAIRNCEAPNGYGGALEVNGDAYQVELSGVTVHGCRAQRCGFLNLVAGTVRLVDISIEDCEASSESAILCSGGTLHAERVRVVRPGVIRFALSLHGDSSWTDCIFSDFVDRSVNFVGAVNKFCFYIASGTHTFTRTTITSFPTAIMHQGVSITTILDSHILDCTGYIGEILDYSCLHVLGGTLALRNTTLRNCGSPQVPAWISFSAEAATNFQSELLTLEPSCDEDPPNSVLISVDSTFKEPLNARGLRVVVPAACPSATFSVFSNHVHLMNCSDGDGICGAAATCTDVQPLPSVPDLTTASCSCQGEVFANPNGTSLALAPYGFDPSAIGLPVGLDRTSVRLPDTTINYCVRAVLFNHCQWFKHA
jgi:hypothetical protein